MDEERYVVEISKKAALWNMLMRSAQSMLPCEENKNVLEKLAGDFFMEAMLCVGLNPHEQYIRYILERILLNDPSLNTEERQRSTNYLLSQMIVKPKGTLAERLALVNCRMHLASKLFPSDNVRLARYVLCPQLSHDVVEMRLNGLRNPQAMPVVRMLFYTMRR